MTSEDKNLLIKDLCGRLPYGVKFEHKYRSEVGKILSITPVYGDVVYFDRYINEHKKCDICDIKPYLFPLSSMTEEQKKEWQSLMISDSFGILYHTIDSFDYLYKNHIDYRGLIPKGLANDATKIKIY